MSNWFKSLMPSVRAGRAPVSRDYRFMARRIEQDYPAHAQGCRLAFVAVGQGGTESGVVLMLANALRSELGARVLVVDGDLRAPPDSLSRRLGLADAPGLADLMAVDSTATLATLRQASRVEGVDLLPAGKAQGRQVVVTRERIRALLDDEPARYSHRLLALPPVRADTRYLITAAEADVVFLVARENHTPMKELDDSRRLLREAGARRLQVIVIDHEV